MRPRQLSLKRDRGPGNTQQSRQTQNPKEKGDKERGQAQLPGGDVLEQNRWAEKGGWEDCRRGRETDQSRERRLGRPGVRVKKQTTQPAYRPP